ncbi:cell wall-binding repeat-containing protein, partial [Peptostreptococcus faecalis]|uniref:cell wall-binding repeat-containing protein n=1 Tax=Peptostreptococcus faecalis TaxID=2045015 RepID=UPI0015E12C39
MKKKVIPIILAFSMVMPGVATVVDANELSIESTPTVIKDNDNKAIKTQAISVANVETTKVTNQEELISALNSLKEHITITKSFEVTKLIEIRKSVTLIGEGNAEIKVSKDIPLHANGEPRGVFYSKQSDDIKKIELENLNFIGDPENQITKNLIFIEDDSLDVIIKKCTFKNFLFDKATGVLHARLNQYKADDLITLSVENSRFENNRNAGDGSAIRMLVNSKIDIKDSVFINNETTAGGGAIYQEAGIDNGTFNNATSLKISNCNFEGNTSNASGAAIYGMYKGSDTEIIIEKSKFNKNVMLGADRGGGAISFTNFNTQAQGKNNTPLKISDTTFTENESKDATSGAAYINRFNTEIKNVAFINNSSSNGGGAFCISSSEDPTSGESSASYNLTIEGDKEKNTYKGNKVFNDGLSSSQGGAISIGDKISSSIENAIFDSNEATMGGGAISIDSYEDTTNHNFKNITFKNNISTAIERSRGGGAILLNGVLKLSIDNNEFIANKSLTNGGAINYNQMDENIETVDIKNSKFIGNNASKLGGGISVFGRQVPPAGATIDDSFNSIYGHLTISNTEFNDNIADLGYYVLDKTIVPKIYSIHEKNIKDLKALSSPGQLGKDVAYNNYDISFLSNKELIAVTFEPEGGKFTDNSTNKKVVEVSKGEKVAEEKISRDGYTFEGWYLDKDGKDKFDFNTAINSNTTLYAKWKKNDVPVTPPGGGGGTINPPTKRATAVLANGKKYTDVLTATVLANERDCPILLTDTNDITTETFNELKRRGIGDVIISGGPDSVSQKVVDQLKDFNVIRYAGSDRYGTAREIGKEV